MTIEELALVLGTVITCKERLAALATRVTLPFVWNSMLRETLKSLEELRVDAEKELHHQTRK